MARRKYLDEDGLAYFWGKIKEWVNGLLTGKQDTLESGVNIKTVNGESLLGEGNVVIEPSVADYEDLSNKPSVGGVTLVGDKSASDLGLATVSQVEAKQDKINSSKKLSYSYLKDTPNLPDNATLLGWGFIKNTVNDLVNYYRKEQTYTKSEVAALIGAIQQFHYEIYAALPQTGQGNVLYLIGPTGSGTDRYEEYVYANNAFTKIGDTSIDLSGYVTTQALDAALASYVKSAALATVATTGSYDDLTNKPTIPQPEVFWAEYGVTTSSELDAQLALGKILACKYDDRVHIFTRKIPATASYNYYWFAAVANDMEYYVRLRDDNQTWCAQNFQFQFTGNRVTSWQTTPDNTHYPSEKLVKDSIDAVDKVFWATYGTTTAAEIDAAVAAGKVVMFYYDGRLYKLEYYKVGEDIMFSNQTKLGLYTITLIRSNNTWTLTGYTVANAGDKVSTISGNETNTTKYPNTKATYDAIHPAVETTQPANGMLPNVMYNLGTLSGNTTFTLATPADANIVNHYYWTFDTPSTAPTITWPQAITDWNGGSAPTINASKHYEVSVMNGIACIIEA